MKSREIVLIVPNVRSSYNVGSLFRSADAFNISCIYLVGYTPQPVDRFGREVKEIAKTALGAHTTVRWIHIDTIAELVIQLKSQGYEVVGLEQTPTSQEYFTASYGEKIALVLGNEVEGMPVQEIDLMDYCIEIPMQGKLARNRQGRDGRKESLNVSVAAGIILAHVRAIQ